ncbi:MAG: hypothetical protein Q8M07_11100 [Prosthecobacter sp.]|nr:hypothetical protein [Prosthecobacter sp.]
MKAVAFLLLFLALWIAPQSHAAPLAPGASSFEVQHDGKAIPVWYYLPEAARSDAPVLIVMHGVNRDADRYRDEWTPHAKKHGFILIAPEFSKEAFPGSDGYNLGTEGAFQFIEPVFDAVKAATGNRSERYHLYGHSAGAQFVHRFLYFVPQARVAKAGWWTMPDPEIDFPYGLRGSTVDAAALRAMLQRPLIVLLGTADTDEHHINLRRTPEALAWTELFRRRKKARGSAACAARLAVGDRTGRGA